MLDTTEKFKILVSIVSLRKEIQLFLGSCQSWGVLTSDSRALAIFFFTLPPFSTFWILCPIHGLVPWRSSAAELVGCLPSQKSHNNYFFPSLREAVKNNLLPWFPLLCVPHLSLMHCCFGGIWQWVVQYCCKEWKSFFTKFGGIWGGWFLLLCSTYYNNESKTNISTDFLFVYGINDKLSLWSIKGNFVKINKMFTDSILTLSIDIYFLR